MTEEPKLLDRLRDRIRLKHYSIRTEKAYLDWNRRFILFHNKKHPRDMGTKEVEQFLTYLAVNLTFCEFITLILWNILRL